LRAKERTAIAMAIAEDDEIFKVVDAAANLPPESADVTAASHGAIPVTKAMLADMYGRLAGRQLVPSTYLLHPVRYADILKLNSDTLDQVSLNVILETGQFGVFFGTRMIVTVRMANLAKHTYTNEYLGQNYIYLLTTADKLGRIPERKAVEVKIFDNVKEAQYDVVAWEQIGIGVHNPSGVTKLALR